MKSTFIFLLMTSIFASTAFASPVQGKYVKQYFQSCLDMDLKAYTDIHHKNEKIKKKQWIKYMNYFCSEEQMSALFNVASKADIDLSLLEISGFETTSDGSGIILQLKYKEHLLPKSLVMLPDCEDSWKIGHAIENPLADSK